MIRECGSSKWVLSQSGLSPGLAPLLTPIALNRSGFKDFEASHLKVQAVSVTLEQITHEAWYEMRGDVSTEQQLDSKFSFNK